VDSYIPQRSVDRPAFLMPVEDVFSISGRGYRGPAASSAACQGRRGNRNSSSAPTQKTIVTGRDVRKLLDQARPGDNSARCCAVPSARKSSAVQCCASRVSVKPHTKFKAEPTSSPRKRADVIPRSSPTTGAFYFRTTDVTGCRASAGRYEMVMPAHIAMEVPLMCDRDGREASLAIAKAAAPSVPASSQALSNNE